MAAAASYGNRKLTDPIKRMIASLPSFVARPVVAGLRKAGALQSDFERYVRIGSPKQILAGPFKGMKYRPYSFGSGVFTKFVGTYELELQPAVEALDQLNHDLIVDIGSAEGYYAVGLTRRLAAKRTVAFDIIPYAHQLMMENARLNGIADKIETRGACDAPTLESILLAGHRPLVVSDCEGFEDNILNPELVPSLKKATMIVETHDHDIPGITDRLCERFKGSHQVERIEAQTRKLSDLTIELDVDGNTLEDWIQEARPDTQCFLFLVPRG